MGTGGKVNGDEVTDELNVRNSSHSLVIVVVWLDIAHPLCFNFSSSPGTCWLVVCEDEMMSWFKTID